MNRKNLELLGLSEGATPEEITAAYESLRAKYLEERFSDGEVGNNAARMLTKIDTAYAELQAELNENAAAEDVGSSFSRVEELLKKNDVQEAQRVLDAFDERNAQWHYLQSVVFFRKNWMNECKKQLEIAINLEPDNDKYREAYRKLTERLTNEAQAQQNGQNQQQYDQGAYRGQNMDYNGGNDQMGGSACSTCLDCCYTYMCVSCFFNSCCR